MSVVNNCFGARTGRIEIIGMFPNGQMRPSFNAWDNRSIAAQIPTGIRGADDHPIAITVVTAEGKRSVALQGAFVAARERVPVPDHSWSPTADLSPLTTDEGGGNLFSGYKVWSAATGSYESDYRIAIAPRCGLDQLEWTTTRGLVREIKGWDQGPAYEANIKVVWSPVCVIHSTDYFVARSDLRICSADVKFKAWAYCPAGLPL